MGLRDTLQIGRIALHPANPEVVFVAGMGHLWGPNKTRGLFRSQDGGKTWAPSLQVDELTGVVDVAIDPSNPNIVYAASYQRQRKAFGFHGGGQGSALWKSSDSGKTWKKLTGWLPAGEYGRICISIYRKDPRIVCIGVEQGLRYNASTEYGEYKARVPLGGQKNVDAHEHLEPSADMPSQIVQSNDDQRLTRSIPPLLGRRRQDVHGASPDAARRRSHRVGGSAQFQPRHEGR
jgi:hypothetical protein